MAGGGDCRMMNLPIECPRAGETPMRFHATVFLLAGLLLIVVGAVVGIIGLIKLFSGGGGSGGGGYDDF